MEFLSSPLFPLLAVVAIMYFMVFRPAQQRSARVKDFQGSLKVDDKVVTSGGMYGTITRLSDQSVQVQIAERVRVEISRNAVVGYQGQEPVTPDSQ